MAQRDPDGPAAKAPLARSPSAAGRLAKALFSHQLRFKRGERGIELVLETADKGSAPSDKAPAPVVDEPSLTMRGDLTALLDSAPGSRQVMRYLAAIENALKTKDARGLFLFDVPVRRLVQALRQLDGLMAETPPAGLVALRVRIADAIRAQESLEREDDLRQPLSSFLVEHKLEVVEARASDFDAVQANWRAASEPPGA